MPLGDGARVAGSNPPLIQRFTVRGEYPARSAALATDIRPPGRTCWSRATGFILWASVAIFELRGLFIGSTPLIGSCRSLGPQPGAPEGARVP